MTLTLGQAQRAGLVDRRLVLAALRTWMMGMLDSRAKKYLQTREQKTCPHTPESCDPAAASRVSIHIREIIYSSKVVTSCKKTLQIYQSEGNGEIEKKVGDVPNYT